jgi:hypothetical protein
MNNTLKIFAALLLGTFVFHSALNFMLGNIEDFETVRLPPKLPKKVVPGNSYPIIKVDATSKDLWTMLDFATGETFNVEEPEQELDKLKQKNWDMGFQRTKIITNGGELKSGAEVGVLNLGPVDIASVTSAPPTGYVQMSKSFGKLSNKAISDWYNYRTRTHNIESNKNVYVVKTHSGRFMKMKILNYYCKNEDVDCRSVMCTREEAACLSITYAFQSEADGKFPPPPSTKKEAQPSTAKNN